MVFLLKHWDEIRYFIKFTLVLNMRNFVLVFILVSLSCSDQHRKKSNDWIALFDGSSLNGWRAYNGKLMPPGWKIIDSVLTFTTSYPLFVRQTPRARKILCRSQRGYLYQRDLENQF